MKSKIWSILVVFILILVVSSTGLYAQRFEGIGVEWLIRTASPSYTLEQLDAIFDEDDLNLSKYLMGEKEVDMKRIEEFLESNVSITTPDGAQMNGKGKDILDKLKEKLMKAQSCRFYSYKINIDVDVEKYYGSSSLDDDVYPIVRFFKIFIHMTNPGDGIIYGASSYRHTRRTFD